MEFTHQIAENSRDIKAHQAFPVFIKNFKSTLESVFYQRTSHDTLGTQRGLPPYVLREVLAADPFMAFIPEVYGGRGGHTHEGIEVISSASYESLALGLTLGINWALFLQPVAKYANEEVKSVIFRNFIEEKRMGGLMITEPNHGSDALNMQTSYTEEREHYHLKGTKHWAGLTGWADYWLLTARKKTPGGNLMRDIDFFISDNNKVGQVIDVEEYFENLGLYMIPYGRNKIDVHIPRMYRLQPKSTGVAMLLDSLHRSRLEIPAMAMGFTKRMLDEALSHCQSRFVGSKSLFAYDQVQYRLACIQSAYTITSAICAHSSEHAKVGADLMDQGLKANAVKSHSTDLMQESAQNLFQLVGAKGYKLNHIAGRAIVDSRPFQIFEGSNDILYVQISEALLKLMKQAKETNLYQFFKDFSLTQKSAEHLKEITNFNLDYSLPQRKLLELGRVVSRVITMEMVIDIGIKGFNQELISDSIEMLKQELTSYFASWSVQNNTIVRLDYEENSHWRDFVNT
ncbi:MAG: acyl-CoA dehydrogenase family protein [Bacteroidales bacterium]|nr:acyl-CoA dehydrogenase family protein [Bacteroidales bacterium]